MKFLIVAACLLAVASAGFIGHSDYSYAPLAYHGLHVPAFDYNGYQLDTPEVAAVKAAHFAAHADANAQNRYSLYSTVSATPVAYASHYTSQYLGPQHIPVIGPNGVPLDTPEVAAGKAANAYFHAEAHARNGDVAVVSPLGYSTHGIYSPYAYAPYHYTGAQHIPVIGPNGVPLDTPEVAAAKVAHSVAHSEARARNAYASYAYAPYYNGPQHLPVIGPNGVPLDTPEVAAAKVAHAVAHSEARARNAYATYAYAPYYTGPQHIPVIGPNGVPLDTPEVAAAKVAHSVAHSEAKARNGDYYVTAPYAYAVHNIVAPVAQAIPVETPEVAQARAAHLAAHIEAKTRHILAYQH